MDSRKIYIGWAQAFFSVLVLWGISNVFMSFSTQILHVNKVVFACATYTSCSLLLLLYAGRGVLSRETIRSVDTWAYGIIMLVNYFITLNLYASVSATEGSLLQRFSVIVSMLFSWLFLMRKPSNIQVVGAILLTLSLLVVAADLPSEIAMQVYVLIFLAAVFQSSRIFVAELHRPHKQASNMQDVKSRCRVVGYVMFIITLLFIVFIGLFTLLQSSMPVADRTLPITPQDFIHAPSIILGMVMGIFIYTPLRYLEFASTHVIKTENFITVTSLSFFSTLMWEWLTSPLTGLTLKTLSTTDIIAGTVVTLGALLMSLSKIRQIGKEDPLKTYLYYAPQDIDQVEDSREIVANGLEHFDGSVKRVATALDVPAQVIDALLLDEEKVLAFQANVLKRVARNYRKNVALSDALTGLANRSAFMTALKSAGYEAENFAVVYLDLNGFKPVNDTYGHEAGDDVLRSVAQRLGGLFEKDALVTRLGGDEFCVLLLRQTKAQVKAHMKAIKEAIEGPVYVGDEMVKISASLGVAYYPEDGKDAQTLLNKADANMYAQKKEAKKS